MKIQLNKSKSSRGRYYLIDGSMGGHGEHSKHPNNFFEVANGVDRGNGYQGYTAVSYFLQEKNVPQEAKDKVLSILKERGLFI